MIVLPVIVIQVQVIVTVLLDGEIAIAMDSNNIDKDSNSGLKEHYAIRHGIKKRVIIFIEILFLLYIIIIVFFVDSKKKDSNVGTFEFSADSKKKDNNTGNPLWLSSDAEYWPEPNVKFVQIAAIHSELIALSAGGQLYQWKWEDTEPYKTIDVCIEI